VAALISLDEVSSNASERGISGCHGSAEKGSTGGRARLALAVLNLPNLLTLALVLDQHLWQSSSMKTGAAAESAQKTFKPFEKGQVWRIGELNLAVISVGKTLVHHKRYTTQPRGVQITMTSKSDLQKYLLNGNAVLVAE
jgi:hypothetical protein